MVSVSVLQISKMTCVVDQSKVFIRSTSYGSKECVGYISQKEYSFLAEKITIPCYCNSEVRVQYRSHWHCPKYLLVLTRTENF